MIDHSTTCDHPERVRCVWGLSVQAAHFVAMRTLDNINSVVVSGSVSKSFRRGAAGKRAAELSGAAALAASPLGEWYRFPDSPFRGSPVKV